MRFAGYIRVSKEEPGGGFSLDSQRNLINRWIKAHGGKLVELYSDESMSGRNTERTQLQQLLRDAQKGRFDAVIVNAFDRLNRNRFDALAIKAFLRHDLGIKVFSVSEPSEDSDGDSGMFVEGIMECVADWYLVNLSGEASKAKRERAMQGLHNNQAPFGMKKDANKVLIPDETELPGLIMAFEEYATGLYSDHAIAQLLNEQGYRTINGNPFSTDTVRGMLQNRVYIGYVKYRAHKYGMGGRIGYRNDGEWIKGQHQAVISEELFEKCLQVREKNALLFRGQVAATENHYLLADLVYCLRCGLHELKDANIKNWGRMRISNGRYNCNAYHYGIKCNGKSVPIEYLDSQFLEWLYGFQPDTKWQMTAGEILDDAIANEEIGHRLAEIKQIVESLDFQWTNGFITDQKEYVQKRKQLREAVLNTRPESDHSQQYQLFMPRFLTEWRRREADITAQQQLLKHFVKHIYVYNHLITQITLIGDYTVNL